MYRLFFIAKNNMKKQKGDMITFFILTFLAAFLIFDCASAILGLGNVMDDRLAAVNGSHIMLMCVDSNAENDSARRAFTENTNIADYEQTPMVRIVAEYKNKKQSDYLQYRFLVEAINQDKTQMTIQGDKRTYQKNDILLPLNMKAGYAIGDVLQLKFGDNVYEFNVVGYLEDPYFCSTVNLTVYSICISQEMIDELADKESGVQKRICHKGRVSSAYLESGRGTEELENDINEKYKEYLSEYAEKEENVNMTDYLLVNWDMMRGGSQFIPMIVMAVMLVFAVLVMVIALVIISFSIKNFIQKNMKDTGILEASGYTVKELRASLILQICLVAFAGALTGMIVAAASFGRFGDVISSMLGLSWNQPVNAGIAAATMIFLILVVAMVAAADSGAYQEVSVLDALRGGINTHNFKRNHFSFEKTPLPIPLVLALKDFAGGAGRNVLIVIISALLVISTLIGFGMVENFGENPEGIMKIMAFELSDASVGGDTNGEDIAQELRALSGVDCVRAQLEFEPVLKYGEKEDTVYTYAVDDMKNTKSTNILEGRMPEKANEILITMGIAQDMGLKCGDVVTLEYANREADYLITGINQRVERMGRTVYMRIDGAEKIVPGDLTRLYTYGIYAKEGVSFETISAQLETLENEKDYDLSIQNDRLFMESTMNNVSSSMSMICLAIVAVTVLVVVFVESLVIRVKISREWRGMGISKALGQTTGGLICQIMLSNIPAVAIGAVIGAVLAQPAGSWIVKAAFSLFVIKNVDFNISMVWRGVCFAGIIITAILAAAAAGLKVKGLKPVEMITEQ
ncbi:MAG: ABC transporter permease [Lachnospiraceae bacterium]|nr:ABC transporter permease [Lachnospiraceae bacterium]